MNKPYQLEEVVTLADSFPARKLTVINKSQLDRIPQLEKLPREARFGIEVAAQVFPFRINTYVADELIDWDNWQTDPLFRLSFPQAGMLSNADFSCLAEAMHSENPTSLQAEVVRIRESLNPHPAGQMEHNVPYLDGLPVPGIQHKYRETVLFFPSQGQTCHTYCTFCFRWAQFIGDKDLKFAAKESSELVNYLAAHPEVTDVLITGGDPLVMKTRFLETIIDTIINDSRLQHIQTIRIGSKALSFWPYRFVSDDDAADLLKLFEKVVASGKQLALMAHYNHWRELETDIAREAIRLVKNTGAMIRSQGPLLQGINDSADVWARMWSDQVNNGIVPYYMFVERDTGARHYFEVPLHKAWQIYRDAMQQVSGVCRTARGPSMSADPGKVEIQGVTEINGERVFVLRFIQGRDSDWVQRPFFAQFDASATWLDDLKPAMGEQQFFYDN